MPRRVTVTFADGSSHVYENAPDDVTPQQIVDRATREFSKPVKKLDGGRGMLERGARAVADTVSGAVGAIDSAMQPLREAVGYDPEEQNRKTDELARQIRERQRADLAKQDGILDTAGDLFTRGMAGASAGIERVASGLALNDAERQRFVTRARENEAIAKTGIAGETTWDAATSNLAKMPGFILEKGIESLPYMATAAVGPFGALSNAAATTGQIAQSRAEGDGRQDASGKDVAIAAPFGTVSTLIDSLSLGALSNGIGGGLARGIMRDAATEGLTEAVQSGIEYTGGSVGTKQGFDLGEMGSQMLQGGLVGAGVGGGFGAVTEGGKEAFDAAGRIKFRRADDTRSPAPGVREMALNDAVNLTPEDLASPLDNEDIAAGRTEIANATAGKTADNALSQAGLPKVGSKVNVSNLPGGKSLTGTIEDVFSDENGDGVVVRPEGGGKPMREYLDTLNELGVSITPSDALAEANAIDAALAAQASAPMEVSSPLPSAGAVTPSPRPSGRTPSKAAGGGVNSAIVEGLKKRGFSEGQALGIAAGIHAESASNPNAKNPTSGAMGLGQWLGPRKEAIRKRFGDNPTLEQQLDFLADELRGGDAGGKYVLAQSEPAKVLDAYVRKFMRPAAGAETDGDIARGMAALGQAPSTTTPEGPLVPESSTQYADLPEVPQQKVEVSAAAPELPDLYHGGREGMSLDDIQIIREPGASKQGKKGRTYGGFYATEKLDEAQGYADMAEGTTVYRVQLAPGSKVETKEGDVTRLSASTIEEYRNRGIDVVVGKDPRGRTEYVVINKDAVTGLVDTKKAQSSASPEDSDPNGFLAMGSGLASGIGENLRKMLLAKVEAGDVTENGKPTPILQAAKLVKDAGITVDAAMLERIQSGINSARESDNFQGGMRDLVASIVSENTAGPQDGEIAPTVEAPKAGGPEATAADSAASAGGAVTYDADPALDYDSTPRAERIKIMKAAGIGSPMLAGGPERNSATEFGRLNAMVQQRIADYLRKNGNPAVPFEQDPEGGTTPSARVEETSTGKSVAVIGASEAEIAAISAAMPKAMGMKRKDGALVYSKKYADKIRAALAGVTKTVAPQDASENTAPRGEGGYTAEAIAKYESSGEEAFKAGKARVAPQTMDGTQARVWYRGWDRANLAAPVPDSDPAPALVIRNLRTGEEQSMPLPPENDPLSPRERAQLDSLKRRNANGEALDDADMVLMMDLDRKAKGETAAAKPTKEERAAATAAAAARLSGAMAEAAQNTPADRVTVVAVDATPSKNRLVTDERAAELRERLKAKLNPGRLNSGIDPEIIAIGTELAVYHIEKGARRFQAFASAIAADLGMKVQDLRLYMRGWYNGARDMMEDAGESVAGMDTPDEVAKSMRTLEQWANEPVQEPSATSSPTPAESSTADPVTAVRDFFLNGGRFATIVEARKFLSEQTGEDIRAGTPEAKRADETIEAAVVQAARTIAARNESNPIAAYRELVDLYQRQPNLAVRSSTSVEQQAYSTPVPLAYLASRRAGIDQNTTVYEPTAGNGALLIDARATYVTANELNPDRNAQLRAIYRGAKITQEDASTFTPPGAQRDVVIANPPFGVVKDADGEARTFNMGDGYVTREIDHAISLMALDSMKNDGKAVLIVGSINKQISTERGRADAYNAKAKREFYYRLYNEYNVTDHFTVAGELYAKQGAGWPVDVIVIEGRGKSALPLPAVKPPRQFDSWAALETEVERRPSVQPATGTAPGNLAQQGAEPARGDGRDSASGRGGRTDRLGQPTAAQQPGDVRAGSPDAEPNGGRLDNASPRSDARPAADNRTRADRRPPQVKREAVAGENARQVTYQPASGAKSLDTLVPVNMQTAISNALGTLQDRVGAVDSYVADRLGFDEKDIATYFSAEQVDALALAIDNMERGAGFIIGDQTGIGKGRVVAGVIRYALRSGRMPIFVTEKPNLYADMYRDMNDVGIPKMLGRPVDILMTNAAEKVPLNEDGSEELKTGPAAKHNAVLERVADGDREGVDVLFTTYSQMQSMKGEWTPRQRAIQRLAPGSIIIFDESHNAGGQGKGNQQRKPKKQKEAEEAGMSAPNRAEFARQIAKLAHGVFFSSATYAKRPDVMDLYASTDMRHAVSDIEKLGDAISKGGIPMQQVVASMLTEAGQYVRRERSFEGVEYRTPPVQVDRASYSQFTGVLRAIQDFQEQHIADAVEAIADDIRAEAQAVSFDGSVGSAGATSTNFTSVMHNVVEQMLLAMKAAPAAARAVELLQEGKKPVITVANTMGSFIKEYADENNIGPNQPMPIDFRSLLIRYLDRTREINIKRPFSKDKAEKRYITDAELGGAGAQAYQRVRAQIEAMDLAAVPVSPVDYIRNEIIKAGYRVGEITGRTATLDYSTKTPRYRIRPGKETSILGRREAITGFNSGTIDAMILNQAGSTGLSLHASATFKDKRTRVMIIAQAERNIDTHMQMLGRIHRTGQVVLPEYDQLVAAVPAEMRPAAVLAKKMASLNANTTGARDSAMTGEDVPDFMNEYGDEIAARMMEEDDVLHKRLGTPLSESDGEKDGYKREDAARKVTGRLMLLPLEEQEAFYDNFLTEYRDYLAQKEAAGEATLEAKTLDLDAKVLASQQVVEPTQPNTPFGEAVYQEVLDVKRLGKPLQPDQIMQDLEQALGPDGFPSSDAQSNMAAIDTAGSQWMDEFRSGPLAAFDAYRRETLDGMDDAKVAANAERLQANLQAFNALASTIHPGATVQLVSPEGDQLRGVVLSVEKKGNPKNPLALGAYRATFAFIEATGRTTIPFSQLRTDRMPESAAARTVYPIRNIDGVPVMQAFSEMQVEAREKRVFLTGNILAAYEHTGNKGQIVNFVDSEGAVRPGLMMRRGWDYQKEMAKRPVPFRTPEQVMAWLEEGETALADNVKVERVGNRLIVTAAAAKSVGGKFFLDKGVLSAVGGDFYKKSTGMVAETTMDKARAVITALQSAGATFTAKTNLDRAREIVAGGGKRQSIPESSPAASPTTDVREALREQLANLRLADKVKVRLVDTLGGAAGEYRAQIVSIAQDTPQGEVFTLNHEAIHVLRDLGLFNTSEWAILSAKARRETGLMRSIRQRYEAGFRQRGMSGAAIEEALIEEAVADMFARHQDGRYKAEGTTDRLFKMLRQFFEAVRNAFAGRDLRTAEGVMQDVADGRVGARNSQGMLDGSARQSQPYKNAPDNLMGFSSDGSRQKAFGQNRYQIEQDVAVTIGGETFVDTIEGLNGPHAMERARRNWPDAENIEAVGEPRRAIKFSIPERDDLVALGGTEPTWKGKAADAFDRWRTAMQDRYLPLLKVQRQIEEQTGKPLPVSRNPYMGEELMTGRIGARLERLAEEHVQPLFDAMHAEKVTTEELESFLYARHAPERNARIAEINPEFTEGEGSGMTDLEAAAIMSRVRKAGKMEAMERLAKRVDQIRDDALDYRVQTGLISKEDADEWRSTYQFYVPLRGFKETGTDAIPERMNRSGGGINVRGRESKQAFGRRSQADSPLAYLILQAEEAIIRGETNIVAARFYNLAKANPDKEFWSINKPTVRQRMNEESGLVESYTTYNLLAEDKDWTVSAKINGREVRVTMNKENLDARRLADAMRNLTQHQLDWVTLHMGKVNRFLSAVNTSYNPEFIITNAFRDLQTATFNLSGEGVKGIVRGTLKDYRKALAASTKGAFGKHSGEWGKWYDEFVMNGGRVYFNKVENVEEIKKRIASAAEMAKAKAGEGGPRLQAKRLFLAGRDMIENLNNGVENAVRLSVYKNAREAGLTPAQAASMAKNVTVNFNRRGTAGPAMNAAYLFFNASVQGSARILMALRSPRVRKMVAGVMIAAAAAEILNAMMSADDDDGESIYDKIPAFEKSRNIVLMMPDGKSYIKIPMPYGYNAFWEAGRSAAEIARRGGDRWKETMGQFVGTVADAFNPIGGSDSLLNILSPTITDPIVDLTLNKDFTGKPIMPNQSPYGPEEPDNQRYFNSVGPHWKAITEFLNASTGGDEVIPGAIDVSPETLEYLSGTVIGSAGAFLDRSLGLIGKSMDESEEITANDIPVARKVVGGKPSWVDKAAFYDRLHAVETAMDRTEKYLEAGNQEAAYEYAMDNKAALMLEGAAKQARKDMREVRKARNELETAKDRDQIDDATYRDKKAIVRRAEELVTTEFNSQWVAVMKARRDEGGGD